MKKRNHARQYFEHLAASQQRQQRLKKAAAELVAAHQGREESDPAAPSPQPMPRPTSPPAATTSAKPNGEEPRPHQQIPKDVRSSDQFGFRHSDFGPSTHPRRQRSGGRPTLFNEDLADLIWEAVRDFGHTDTAAAAKFGVAASTLSRWKRDNEFFATDLEAARVEYKETVLSKIRGARKRDGSPDWRAYAWILERTFPDEFGRRTRKPPESEPAPEVDEDLTSLREEILPPKNTEDLQVFHNKLARAPETWEHKQTVAHPDDRFEERKAASLAQNPPVPASV